MEAIFSSFWLGKERSALVFGPCIHLNCFYLWMISQTLQ